MPLRMTRIKNCVGGRGMKVLIIKMEARAARVRSE
jgi:hypothetical protein